MSIERLRYFVIGMCCAVFGFGSFLSSSIVSADEIYDDRVVASVPASCSMTASGMNSHTATVPSGTVNSSIGETTINVFCNDYEGFAVYAIGYTDDTNGNNVLTNSEIGSTYDIETGLATSGNTSNWAMKLSTITSPTPTYPVTIESDQSGSFSSFHTVPDDYTKVAKRTSATDVGQNAEGSTIKTTYQAYVSVSQLTGTYTGKVKYLLVHPNYVDKSAFEDAITVVFDGNGLTFPDGSTTNTVKYANVCKPGGTGYVGSNYQEVMTSNITTGGTQNGAYTDHEEYYQTITLPNVDKIKVEVEYATTGDTAALVIAEGTWDGDWHTMPDNSLEIYDTINYSGTRSYAVDGDTVTILIESWDTPESGYDKGFYVRLYPAYNTEQSNTTYEEFSSNDCSVTAFSGRYLETVPWNGGWITTIDGNEVKFTNEVQDTYDYTMVYPTAEGPITRYLESRYSLLSGSTVTFYAYNPVTFDMVYAAANKTKVNNYYTIQDLSASMCADVTVEQTTTVIDIRDNTTYSIGKFKDGNCWLRANLRLDPTVSTTAANMSSSNTNASDAAINNYLYGGSSSGVNGWASAPVSANTSGDSYSMPMVHHRYDDNYDYNYCAISAGTYCYEYESSGVDIANTDIDSPYDICPNNWRVPSYSEFTNLSNLISINDFSEEGPRTGYRYWTSTYDSDHSMEIVRISWNDSSPFELYVSSGNSSAVDRDRGNSFPIRCFLPTS